MSPLVMSVTTARSSRAGAPSFCSFGRAGIQVSASFLSHLETPCFPAFLRYPAFSCGVQRNSTRAVAGFFMGGLPLGRLGLSMPDIVPVQIIIDKPCRHALLYVHE